MTVTTVVTALQTINASATGIKTTPTNIPGSLPSASLPAIIVWPSGAESILRGQHKESQRIYTCTVYVKPFSQGLGVSEGWKAATTYLQRLVEEYTTVGNVLLVNSGGYQASIRLDEDNPVLDDGISVYAYPPPATGQPEWPHYFGCQFRVTVKEEWAGS